MKSIAKLLFSTRLMAVLFVVFAVAMGVGTFIESWYSTDTARIWVYNATWFEAIMVFFVLNFSGNIARYRLLRKEKWAVLTLHVSWILIIIGAFITRYISYEGMMPIREGATENSVYSSNAFLTLYVDGPVGDQKLRRTLEDDLIVTEQGIKSSLPWTMDFENTPIRVDFVRFEQGMQLGLVPDSSGTRYLQIVESSEGSRHDHYLAQGEISSIHNLLFAYDKPTEGAINLTSTPEGLTIQSPFEGSFMRMADQFSDAVSVGETAQLQLRSLYQLGGVQFVIPEPPVQGVMGIVKADDNLPKDQLQDAFTVRVWVGEASEEITVLGSKGASSFSQPVSIGNHDITVGYGSKVYTLPFSITLNDFIAQKYPGTEKGYSSFMSKITVVDDRPFDYDIYMNHVLDHQGYRFFQSSFHPDEQGTVLSVNYDQWGTWITYLGYILLYLGLMGIFFFGDTRFKQLSKSLDKFSSKKSLLTIAALLTLGTSWGQTDHDVAHGAVTPTDLSSLITKTVVAPEHARKFSALVIQDDNGRMKPLHTFTSELLRKLSFKDQYEGLNADQVFLSMQLNPAAWYQMPFLTIDKQANNDSIRRIIGAPLGQKLFKATDFFDDQGRYLLAPYLQDAYGTNSPNQFQKDFKNIDLKLGLLNRALSGEILKIFPVPDDENNKWISALEYRSGGYEIADSLYSNFVTNGLRYYLMSLQKSVETGDYSESDKILEAIAQNQELLGNNVLPSKQKIEAEILYNELDLFNRLYHYQLMFGAFLFLVLIFQIFRDTKWVRTTASIFVWAIALTFVAHTFGLVFRWYLSGHAPWSDAYESILYVGWATLGFGLVFGRKNRLTLASATFVTSMLLWIAHQSWVDPSIANLVPVLDSYWLMIHVAIIVGSYGPLTVGMILGIVSLLLMVITTQGTKIKMESHIKELTVINELSITVGLVMLTIGNFLGGMWANESWGRYWGWDPKETWALISIMVYAFVIHGRLIPGLRGAWTFNLMTVLAYASIMMTYFGVNFYLVGLHSYASGEQVITPTFIWYTLFGVFVLALISRWRYQVVFKKK